MAETRQERAKRRRTLAILRRARALVAKDGGWTRGRDARDARGREVDIKSRAARAFCVGGACVRATSGMCDELLLGDVFEAMRAVIGVRGEHAISDWNDKPRRTQKQVVAAFDKAIARMEA